MRHDEALQGPSVHAMQPSLAVGVARRVSVPLVARSNSVMASVTPADVLYAPATYTWLEFGANTIRLRMFTPPTIVHAASSIERHADVPVRAVTVPVAGSRSNVVMRFCETT